VVLTLNFVVTINTYKGEKMPTPHISAQIGDIAKTVLMPGDPKRSEWIAKTFLKDARLVNDVRGNLAFTGITESGKEVTVMSSGMGMPSIGIYSHELFSHYGVETIIRVGTCGSYLENIRVRDLLIAEEAITDSSWAKTHGLPEGYIAKATEELVEIAKEEAEGKAFVGQMISSDTFYDFDENSWKEYQAQGVMGVEMEAYALYCNAIHFNKKALAICTVSDSFVYKDEISAEERMNSLTNMVNLAFRIVERLG